MEGRLSLCMYICIFKRRICWKASQYSAKLLRSNYIWTIFILPLFSVRLIMLWRWPTYASRRMFVTICLITERYSAQLATHWVPEPPSLHIRQYNELYGKHHILSVGKVRGENCGPQDTNQLHLNGNRFRSSYVAFDRKSDRTGFGNSWRLLYEMHTLNENKIGKVKWTCSANAFFVILCDVLLTHSLPSLMQL